MGKRYRVDFYDMFDGWISNYLKYNGNEFDTLEEAISMRDKKNDELPESNKNCGEHWVVIDLQTRTEICCPIKTKDQS